MKFAMELDVPVRVRFTVSVEDDVYAIVGLRSPSGAEVRRGLSSDEAALAIEAEIERRRNGRRA